MAESLTQRTGLGPPCGPQTCDNIAEAKSQQPSVSMRQRGATHAGGQKRRAQPSGGVL